MRVVLGCLGVIVFFFRRVCAVCLYPACILLQLLMLRVV